MKFPVCSHARRKQSTPALLLGWLAAEPYRLFFISGALWSVVGVLLWPWYYLHGAGFYPGIIHARLMIEAFGGAFVVGFLGTAGPRMATAPKLSPAELLWLLLLHEASSLCHLSLQTAWGDALFLALLGSLMLALVIRIVRWRKEAPPPQLLLAFTGLLCGAAGTTLLLRTATALDPAALRLANLLLYQGFLLTPVLGIGAFIFPRILGGGFGESGDAVQARRKLSRTALTALLLVTSFFLEAAGQVKAGYALRAGVATAFLLMEVRWRREPGQPPPGSLATGMKWALLSGLAGLGLAAFFYPQHVAMEHLLYIGGFGLLILVVASRVLFGHAGELAAFAARSGWVRFLIVLGMLAATTRMSTGLLPRLTVSHHVYAALTWALLAVCWLLWHRRRFFKRDDEE